MSNFEDLQGVMDNVSEGVAALRATQTKELGTIRTEQAALLDRLETLEAVGTRPKKSFADSELNYKRYRTSNGDVYELPSTTKMQDVLPPEKKPEIELHRWLAATIGGEKCGDAEAVRYVRESKAMATTSTGVLVPAEYIQPMDRLDSLAIGTAASRRAHRHDDSKNANNERSDCRPNCKLAFGGGQYLRCESYVCESRFDFSNAGDSMPGEFGTEPRFSEFRLATGHGDDWCDGCRAGSSWTRR